ncbi:MAG TPA: amidohydrolase family protein [Acidimicrobiales bacterium]|nr:amidohydrolase family protein [Acidimicrobiales bacterium]
MTAAARDLTIRSVRLGPGDGDPAGPVDVHVVGGVITTIAAPTDDRGRGREIDGRGMLCMPGFVNAHHHSYDVLAKGLLEDMPFDVWALHSQPGYLGPRRAEELRARTLLSGLECIRSGITTVQDMCSLVPFDEPCLDAILGAYAELGIRVVFSIAVRDVAALDIRPFLRDVPPDQLAIVEGAAAPAGEQLAFVEAQLARLPADGLRTWALSPSGPQRCTTPLLEGLAALSADHGLPVFTHVYETKAQTAKAREIYPSDGGSMIAHLDRIGLLTERTSLVHAVWITRSELDQVAAAGSRIVHNPVSNMKLKSGIAPMVAARRAGVEVALGCDNCSCGDSHNMFQAMKAYCLLAAVSTSGPNGLHAGDAVRSATSVGAAALHLPTVGAVREGMAADLVLYDLDDLAYQPLNDVTRQLVFCESGRGVRTVVVDGRIVLDDGACTSVDEAALRDELVELMPTFRADVEANRRRAAPIERSLLDCLERLRGHDVGLSRILDH